MTDPITDMLNRIRSSKAVLKPELNVPFSKIKYEIAKILTQEGFTGEVKKVVKGKARAIKIILKYENRVSKISDLRRVSKPGQRIYEKASKIKKVKGGYGISIISTSKGLMTNKKAHNLKLGGEIICEIW